MIEDEICKFEDQLRQQRRSSGAAFSESELEQLKKYYALVLKWNSRLHLTTETDPSCFFNRHIFESDFAETFISPSVAEVWDLGTGLGVPGIPLAILRPDLTIHLVESKRGKAIFLEEVASILNLSNVSVVQGRIEELKEFPKNSCLIARAVEQMESVVFEMMRLGENCRQIIVLGAEELSKRFCKDSSSNFHVHTAAIPGSVRKFVISGESFT